MSMLRNFFSLAVLFTATSLFGQLPMLQQQQQNPQEIQKLIIDNRILTTVRGKTISVLDVVKKMDVFINQKYPDVLTSNIARYQFYRSNWKEALQQIVENELVLADAETLDIKISDGEIRETMQKRFGPNVLETLDKLDISYDEARELVQSDLIVQQMTWFRVNSKVLLSVNPKDIKSAYHTFCLENPPSEEWHYRVISIRNVSEELGTTLANKAYDLLQRAKGEEVLAALPTSLKEQIEDGLADSVVSISNEFKVDEKKISNAHREVLCKMDPGTYSKPTTQLSRVNDALVHRIFYLKDRIVHKAPTFYDMENRLQDNLLQNVYSEKMPAYIEKLRERYGIAHEQLEEAASPNFEPFRVN